MTTSSALSPTTDGQLTAPEAPEVLNLLPQAPGSRYHALQLHARGGLGEIYVARDGECDREVALKTVQQGCTDAGQARFLREAAITARLQHPGIVPVYGISTTADGRPQYSMRFISGVTLTDAVRQFHDNEHPKRDATERSLARRQLLQHFVTVCNVMSYAHSRGVIHRDLKPDNVMLGPFGETLVVDWGSGRWWGRPSRKVQIPPGAEHRN